ncbi:MAG: phosphohistidine phosphatase SixA [Planctomycetota bacterium]
MWIYLLRHGIAEDPGHGQLDDDRALTEEGLYRLRRSGTVWQKLLPPLEVVLTSPLLRARQTTEILLEAMQGSDLSDQDPAAAVQPRIEPCLAPHGNTTDAVIKLEAELLSGTKCVAIVGHEPHLGYLLGNLTTGQTHLSIPLKKGMLVALQCDSKTSLTCGLRFSLTYKAVQQLLQDSGS